MLSGCECYEVDVDESTLKLLQASQEPILLYLRVCIPPHFYFGLAAGRWPQLYSAAFFFLDGNVCRIPRFLFCSTFIPLLCFSASFFLLHFIPPLFFSAAFVIHRCFVLAAY